MIKFLTLVLLSVSATSFASTSGIVSETSSDLQSERNDRVFLFRLEPTYLIFKELNFDFQFKISHQFTLGPTLGIMREGPGVFYGTKVSNHLFYDDRTNRESYGVRGVYYFRSVNVSSAYMAGSVQYAMNHVTSTSNSSLFGPSTQKGDFNEIVGGLTGGYQWVLRRFLVNVGGGIGHYSHPSKMNMTDEKGVTHPYELDEEKFSYLLDAGVGINF